MLYLFFKNLNRNNSSIGCRKVEKIYFVSKLEKKARLIACLITVQNFFNVVNTVNKKICKKIF